MDATDTAEIMRQEYMKRLEETSPQAQFSPPPVIQDDAKMAAYLSPTLITIPLVVVLIIVLASTAQIAIKIFVLLLVIISLGAYYAERNNINLVKYVKSTSKSRLE